MKSFTRFVAAAAIIVSALQLHAQTLEFYGGMSRNYLYDNKTQNIFYSSSYTARNGLCIGMAVDSINLKWISLRASFQFEEVTGDLSVMEARKYFQQVIVAQTKKYIFSAALYPVNLLLFKKLAINIGAEVSGKIDEKNKGTFQDPCFSERIINFEDGYVHYYANLSIGLKGRLAWAVRLSSSTIITPQYQFYYGLTNEFDEAPEEAKSIRHYLMLGFTTRF